MPPPTHRSTLPHRSPDRAFEGGCDERKLQLCRGADDAAPSVTPRPGKAAWRSDRPWVALLRPRTRRKSPAETSTASIRSAVSLTAFLGSDPVGNLVACGEPE